MNLDAGDAQMRMSKSWEEYASDQRYAAGQDLASIRKTLIGILFVLILLLIVVGLPMIWLMSQ